jgi:hypothetical protein
VSVPGNQLIHGIPAVRSRHSRHRHKDSGRGERARDAQRIAAEDHRHLVGSCHGRRALPDGGVFGGSRICRRRVRLGTMTICRSILAVSFNLSTLT